MKKMILFFVFVMFMNTGCLYIAKEGYQSVKEIQRKSERKKREQEKQAEMKKREQEKQAEMKKREQEKQAEMKKREQEKQDKMISNCNQGDSENCLSLAEEALKTNKIKAEKYFEKSCEYNDESCFLLAKMQVQGIFGEQKINKGYRTLTKICKNEQQEVHEQTKGEACLIIGHYFEDKEDMTKAKKYYRRSCKLYDDGCYAQYETYSEDEIITMADSDLVRFFEVFKHNGENEEVSVITKEMERRQLLAEEEEKRQKLAEIEKEKEQEIAFYRSIEISPQTFFVQYFNDFNYVILKDDLIKGVRIIHNVEKSWSVFLDLKQKDVKKTLEKEILKISKINLKILKEGKAISLEMADFVYKCKYSYMPPSQRDKEEKALSKKYEKYQKKVEEYKNKYVQLSFIYSPEDYSETLKNHHIMKELKEEGFQGY